MNYTAQRQETVDYSDVLRGSAALAGFGLDDLGTPEFRLFRTFHDRRLKVAWEIHHWPWVCQVERRSFRAPYDATGATTYAAGAEVLDGLTLQYFQALQPSTNCPPTVAGVENSAYWAVSRPMYSADIYSGTAVYGVGAQVQNPADQNYYQRIVDTGVAEANFIAANWGVLTPFNRVIAPRQAWAATVIGEFLAAFDRDPRQTTKRVKLPFELSADGAQFTQLRSGLAYVWIYFRVARPRLDGELLDLTAVYTAGRAAYYTAAATGQGNFYVAQTTTTAGDTPESAPAKWSVVPIPYAFAEYLMQGGFNDWLTSDGQGTKAAAGEPQATALLELEADKLQRQSQQVNRLDWKN